MTKPTFYVTTPIYYVNDRPHIGHVYTTTIADVLARYHRMRGDDVFFLTGTDEHAAKVVDAAAERDLTPQQWADRNAEAFETTFRRLGMTHDDFIRTSQDRHKQKVSEYVTALLNSGDVYEGTYEGWYDAGEEEYVPENKAKENDFKSAISGKPLVRKTEKNYFFRLSAYRQQLIDHFNANPTFVQPDARRNEILNRIAEAEDVPISRTGMEGWGIKVPGDDSQTIYVWIDALFNYLTTVDTPERRHYWPADVHLIAKDILWFHAAIWPAVLLALSKCEGYDWVALPRQIYAHSWWIAEGRKMSKSLGNFIDLEKIDYYVETFGLDALRWFLTRYGPMGTTDADFAHDAFVEAYNQDLANTFGNSTSRVTKMLHKYFDGTLPEDVAFDDVLKEAAEKTTASYHENINQLRLADALGNGPLALVQEIDAFIERTAPFKLAKQEEKLPEVGAILGRCAEALRIASLNLAPVLPNQVAELWQRFNSQSYAAEIETGGGDLDNWTSWGGLMPGDTLAQGDPLYPRYQPPKG
ncbi:methionine--tRNA ligase [Mucisphaera calidilacus]|uniref:Methionine--tRNA ligase n=1 Tax=Mucisphaera calidilacus TaxID=2527982 RepID=A0A518BZU1_9BACT|nr:methionine--tRNA ligase [Mucisphaera calidilacus]QDU72493.1 Methionine--tRNA ligase [Mucisphaera calidilacus]